MAIINYLITQVHVGNEDVQAVRGQGRGTKSSIAGVIEQMQGWGGAYSFLLEESATLQLYPQPKAPQDTKLASSLRSGFGSS